MSCNVAGANSEMSTEYSRQIVYVCICHCNKAYPSKCVPVKIKPELGTSSRCMNPYSNSDKNKTGGT